jgi:membrane-anchored mycosin MYCP
VFGLLGAPAHAVAAAVPPAPVKYLVVQANQGRPDYLWEIALRVLDDKQRYLEIFALNKGRLEPDGATVTDPAVLHEGWILVLPWDATGDGVIYGPLPAITPTASPPASPARRPGSTTVTGSEMICTVPPKRTSGGVPWAQLRLAPEAAWSRGKGDGVLVAVIDSGVDATVPALSGRVRTGADATQPATSLGGDRDCTGHGTAMAGIIAAQPRKGTDFVGIAPAASILPIKVALASGVVDSAQLVTALRLAVGSGARVAMIGAAVDDSDDKVIAGLREAVAANVVVVLGASAQTAAKGKELPEGVLRVGAVGPDDLLTEVYRPDGVDVVAPGVDVVSLGIGGAGEVEGSGTGYAVPFVAGVVALLRASEPSLTVAQVADRIKATSDSGAAGEADPFYGWGVINPAAAVNAEPIRPSSTLATKSTAGAIAAVIGILALAALAFGLRRRH